MFAIVNRDFAALARGGIRKNIENVAIEIECHGCSLPMNSLFPIWWI
jgi:hypothetical protein